MSDKLIALLNGLCVPDPEYWAIRSEKEIREMGKAYANCIEVLALEKTNIIDTLSNCASRLKLLEEYKRAKTLDILALMQAEEIIRRLTDD